MTGFASWFFNGLGGAGGWVIIAPISLIAALWLTVDSARRHILMARWRIGVWVPALLHLPTLVVKLGARGDSGFYTIVALLGLVGAALSAGIAAGFFTRFRGLMGCAKGHPPYPDKYKVCPVCARQTVPGVPGYTPNLGIARTSAGIGRTSAGSPRKPRIKVDAWLVTIEGSLYQLNMKETTVGRNAECDIRLWDTSTSRTHAKIAEEKGAFTIYDLGSVVGTFVNGRRVRRPEPIKEGDIITFGTGTRMVFTLDPDNATIPAQG
jgi:hypothetical protein